jgi:hypothetical protein
MKKSFKQDYAIKDFKFIDSFVKFKNKGVIYKIEWIFSDNAFSLNPTLKNKNNSATFEK